MALNRVWSHISRFSNIKSQTEKRGEWKEPWKASEERPEIYPCNYRVVDRRFVSGDAQLKHFRMFVRMLENLSSCRLFSPFIMSNQFHILLEMPPMPEGGIPDEKLLKRLSATNAEAFVNEAFAAAWDRFTEMHKDGARPMKRNGEAAIGLLCCMRDLRVPVSGKRENTK